MAGAVAVVDLGQAVVHVDVLAVGAGGHVTEGQRVGQRPRRRGELAVQDVGEAALLGLDDGAGVVRDQAAQQGFGVLDVAQVAGAVQAVQAGVGEFGEVADVVQPRGGLDQIGVGVEGRVEGAGPGGDALDVGPAAGKRAGQEGAGEVLGPGCDGCMKSTLVSRAGTCTDAAWRLETSETSLLPRASHDGQITASFEAGRDRLNDLHGGRGGGGW